VKHFLITSLVVGLAAGNALAQNGNPCPGKKEYQFNIIGVANPKTQPLTNDNGRRLFVPLKGATNIYFTGDTDFNDANGLQCGNNFNVVDANGTDGSATVLVPCTKVTAASTTTGICFDVWATTLGGPGSANVDIVCSFDGTVSSDTNIDSGDCAMGTGVDIPLERKSGRPVQTDVTKFFRASGCFDTIDDGVCTAGEKTFSNVWIFNLEALIEYYWIYDNNGLRVTQIRFCASDDCGSFGTFGA